MKAYHLLCGRKATNSNLAQVNTAERLEATCRGHWWSDLSINLLQLLRCGLHVNVLVLAGLL